MPAEERKLATVLFADLVGSTELASDQDPERVRAMLDRFYDAMAAEIEQAGGDRERMEAEAPKWTQGGGFAGPFALRALGIARGDRTLLGQALGRFEAMELSWHAEQTRRLLL
jgi:class 3 adenylate cyclase